MPGSSAPTRTPVSRLADAGSSWYRRASRSHPAVAAPARHSAARATVSLTTRMVSGLQARNTVAVQDRIHLAAAPLQEGVELGAPRLVAAPNRHGDLERKRQ